MRLTHRHRQAITPYAETIRKAWRAGPQRRLDRFVENKMRTLGITKRTTPRCKNRAKWDLAIRQFIISLILAEKEAPNNKNDWDEIVELPRGDRPIVVRTSRLPTCLRHTNLMIVGKAIGESKAILRKLIGLIRAGVKLEPKQVIQLDKTYVLVQVRYKGTRYLVIVDTQNGQKDQRKTSRKAPRKSRCAKL